MYFGTLAALDRLIDRGEPVGDLPGTAQSFRHPTQEMGEPQGGHCFAEFLKAGAQQP